MNSFKVLDMVNQIEIIPFLIENSQDLVILYALYSKTSL